MQLPSVHFLRNSAQIGLVFSKPEFTCGRNQNYSHPSPLREPTSQNRTNLHNAPPHPTPNSNQNLPLTSNWLRFEKRPDCLSSNPAHL